MKKKLLIASTTILIIVTGFLAATSRHKPESIQVNEISTSSFPITGTFIMADMPGDVEPFFDEMQATGINTVIFLASGGLEGPCYPNPPSFTEKYYFDLPAPNWYLDALKEAKKRGMGIVFGLVNADIQVCMPYWIGNADDPNTFAGRFIDYSARLSIQVKQTVSDLGWDWNSPQFIGFYLFERGLGNFSSASNYETRVYKRLSADVKARVGNKKILISPWVVDKYTYDDAKNAYINLYNAGIDIIAPQDSMGTLKVTSYTKSAELFKALHDAAQTVGGDKEAWANIETQLQATTTSDYDPSNIDRVSQQISAAKPHVTKMITWIYQHTMASTPQLDNAPWTWTHQYTPEHAIARKKLRNDYLAYYGPHDWIRFDDITPSHPSFNAINILTAKGIVYGCQVSPALYCPDTPVTRSSSAIFILKSKHGGSYTPPAISTSSFTDVPANHWAAPWIAQLAAEGITGGCGGGNFCPDGTLTRAQIAVMLLKAKHGTNFVPPTATGLFSDVPTTHWAAPWIEQLKRAGITSGCGNNNYCPDQVVSRASMAVLLVATFNLTQTPTTIPGDFNADGHVNSSDYAIFIAGFQSKKYTIFDYVSLVANYGK